MTEQNDRCDVTWQSARDTLVRDLMIDDEWLVEGEQAFTWWPWCLAQRVEVSNSELLVTGDDRDQLVRLTSTVDVLPYADAESGAGYVQQLNNFFPFGAWIWRDGIVSLTSSVALNRQCTDLLPQFRDACLIAAATAHDAVRSMPPEMAAEALVSAHPSSGIREHPDEMLSIYSEGEFSLDVSPSIGQSLGAVRDICAEVLANQGVEREQVSPTMDSYFLGRPVYIAEEVDTFTSSAFGPGLVVLTLVDPPGRILSPELVNFGNVSLAEAPRTSHLGVFMSSEGAQEYGSPIRTYLSYPYLARASRDAEGAGVSLLNAVLHSVAAADYLTDALDL